MENGVVVKALFDIVGKVTGRQRRFLVVKLDDKRA
jgi:hypothetical protein